MTAQDMSEKAPEKLPPPRGSHEGHPGQRELTSAPGRSPPPPHGGPQLAS